MKEALRKVPKALAALALIVALQEAALAAKAKPIAVEAESTATSTTATAQATPEVAAQALSPTTGADYNFEDYVVTSTKQKLSVKDSPAAASVVTQKDIQKKISLYADDLVNDLPGTQVLHPQIGATSGTVVSMRGIPNVEKNLILLDGHSIQNTMNANTWWNRVPTDLVDHIEVVRGPFSALYGARAVGGVINIITEEPEGRDLDLKYDYLSFGGRTVTLNYRDKPLDNLSYYVGVQDQLVDGYTNHNYVQAYALTYTATASGTVKGAQKTTDSQGGTIYNIGEKAKTLTQNDNLTGKIYYTPWAGHTFSLIANYAVWDQPAAEGQTGKTWLKDNSTGAYSPSNGIYTIAGTGDKIKITQQNFYTAPGNNGIFGTALTYKAKWSDALSTSLDLVFDGGNYYKSASSIDSAATALSGKGTSGSETPDDRRFLENLQGFLTLGDHKLVLGVENNQDNDRNYTLASSNWAEQDHYYETNINRNSNERISAVFAQDEWKVISPLTVYLGARFDNWDSSGGQAWNSSTKQLDDYGDKQASVFSPKVSVVYQLFKEGRLKASAGHSFDPPMPLQLYSWTAGTNSNGVASVTVGNPNLQPETDDAWEFGADFDFPTKTHVAATYFENYLHNLIYSGYEPGTNNTLSTYYNAGEAQDKGVEVEVKQQVLSNLDIFGNYTYAHNVFTENSSIPTSVGKFVPGVAEHTAHLGLDYSINKLTATLEANYSSKVYRQADNSDTVNGVQGSYDPFTVYNAKLSYRLLENGTIHVGVNNIFDNKYYAIYQQVGRYYEVGANLNLF